MKLQSMKLAMKYLRRVSSELEAIQGGPDEEELMLQGVRFAFRVHQVTTPFNSSNLYMVLNPVVSCSLQADSTAARCEHFRISRRSIDVPVATGEPTPAKARWQELKHSVFIAAHCRRIVEMFNTQFVSKEQFQILDFIVRWREFRGKSLK
uniref:Uncharacterized protein n=1 Tax=Arundo donax TaxID=35708 RepID=A0A0A9CJ06_ARUDO